MARGRMSRPDDFYKKTADISRLAKGGTPITGLVIGKGKATQAQWEWIDITIKAFITKYPAEWMSFQEDLKRNRTKFQDVLAIHGNTDLKKANWRNVASFPVVMRWDADKKDYVEEFSLLPLLKRFIPDLTDKGANFNEFIRRYPEFRAGEKI